MHLREIERHTAQLRAAGEDRALSIMARLIHDVVNTAAIRAGTSWEAAWEAAARHARAGIARVAKERGECKENRPDNRFDLKPGQRFPTLSARRFSEPAPSRDSTDLHADADPHDALHGRPSVHSNPIWQLSQRERRILTMRSRCPATAATRELIARRTRAAGASAGDGTGRDGRGIVRASVNWPLTSRPRSQSRSTRSLSDVTRPSRPHEPFEVSEASVVVPSMAARGPDRAAR